MNHHGEDVVNTIEYDFEGYALEHGIPDTLDPLPYRKTGSVFSEETEEPVLTSAKHDPRLRTVVCRHWLRDLCMKGAACEFLHQYDLQKMPICRHGEDCKVKNCPFRHIREENRMECAFYKSGFCIHGQFCRYKHTRRPREDLPAVADFSVGLSQMQAGGDKMVKRVAPKPNEYYKISLCKHFIAGDCPFGENCHFAHGENELRDFPGKETGDQIEEVFDQSHTAHDYYEGGASGGGKPCPILEPEQARFFISAAATYRDLAHSCKSGEWYFQKADAEKLNQAYDKGKHEVMIFFTVAESSHIQGAAILTSEGQREKAADHGKKSFSYRFSVEWYRTTELKNATALTVASDLRLPNADESIKPMDSKTGESLMKAVWNAPLVTLYESWIDDEDPPAADALLTDFRVPAPSDFPWPTMPVPGFIFGCSSDTMDECLGRGIFGLPAHMKAAASSIVPGASIFLFNVTDRLLFGIFEALTTARLNIEPAAFSKNPKSTSSPFPVQIRVRIGLECPPLEDTDAVLNNILRFRGKGRIGVVTHAQAEAIASLLAQQCGALDYMAEFNEARRNGMTNLREPPIALPPKHLSRNSRD